MDHFFSLLLEIDNQHESTLVSGLLSAEKIEIWSLKDKHLWQQQENVIENEKSSD